MIKFFQSFATLPLLLCLVSCGSSETVRPIPPSAPPAAPVYSPPASLPGGQDELAQQIIAYTVGKMGVVRAYSLDMHWMQKQGGDVARGVYEIKGKAPRSTLSDIKKGKGEGSKVLFTGGDKAKVRAAGLLGAIAVDLAVTDERLRSVRGYTIPQTDLKALLDQLADPRHQARVLQRDAQRAALEVSGGPLLEGCQRMVAEINLQTGVPLSISQFDAREAVFQIQIRNFQVRQNVSLDL
jgi:hypothetical protein